MLIRVGPVGFLSAALLLLPTGCDGGGGNQMDSATIADDDGAQASAGGDSHEPESTDQPSSTHFWQDSSAEPGGESATETPSAGSAGIGGAPHVSGPPFGTSTTCGDAIVGSNEECDDGPGAGRDACTAGCQTTDQPAAPSVNADRYLGAGRHPNAGLSSGFITTFVELPSEGAAVGANLFDIWGKPSLHVDVSEGAAPIDDANPVAAALPNGSYAVAWSDFDADGSDLGVALRQVNGDGSVGLLRVANGKHEFSQLNPDVVWTGSQLVVAWEDHADPLKGPDLHYRIFDQSLNPTTADIALAESALPEAAVALTAFNGSWAAAYREGTADGKENVVVRAADKTFRLGPVLGGPADDRPALVALDASHLLLVFSAGTDPGATGVYNVPRLRYSVIDTASVAPPTFQSLNPLDDLFTVDDKVSHFSPAAAPGVGGAYVAWRSEARPGDAAGDQLWLKYLSWDSAAAKLEPLEQEMLIPRTCEGSIGDQRRPALANVALPPSNALAVAWDDYSHSQGIDAGDPDVVVHYAPLHARDSARSRSFSEHWTGLNGAAWSPHWTTELSPAGILTVDVQNNQGRIVTSATTGATGLAYVNDHTALNVDMVSKVRVNLTGADAVLVARRADVDADTYFAVNLPMTTVGGLMRIYAVIDNASPAANNINTATMPYLFGRYTQGLDYYLRFRVITNSDQSVSLSAKYWLIDQPEPSGWFITGTVPANPTAGSALATIKQKLGNRAGRFGVLALESTNTRSVTFDDFQANFLEGAQLGDPTSNAAPDLPLMRAAAAYRTCTASAPCTAGQGCCLGGSDCATGLACSGASSAMFGLGSHAQTCAPDHCTDKIVDGGEQLVDCGGPDCAPCTCAPTVASGAAGYCTAGCPCGIGGTDCQTNADCLSGLICVQEAGYRYGFAVGSDTCMPQHCTDRVQDSNETGVDTGGDCGSVACDPAGNICTVSCVCGKGQGDCDYNDECQSGMSCGAGAQFGVAINVCAKTHCFNKVKDSDEISKDCGGADCGTVCP
jgi:hypothetical protein